MWWSALVSFLLGLLKWAVGANKPGQVDAATDPDLKDEFDGLGDDLPPFNPS